jgi:hypothetical protein
MDKNKCLMGIDFTRTDQLRPEYAGKFGKDDVVVVGVYLLKKEKRLSVEVFRYPGFQALWNRGMTKKDIADQRKRFSKINWDSNKPVDTSKWVFPDKESIGHCYLDYFGRCLVYAPESERYKMNYAKMDLAFSIYHSHSPKNPQGIGNYANASGIDAMYRVLGNKAKEAFFWRNIIGVSFKGQIRRRLPASRERYPEWVKKETAEIVKVI